jgi:hypothetical protein
VSCEYGEIEVAKLLLTLKDTHGEVDIHSADDYALKHACDNGYTEVVKWLLTLDKFNNEVVDMYISESLYEYAFEMGYMPVKKMVRAYEIYKSKILKEVQQKHTTGDLTIFEIKGLPELIVSYV